MLTKQQEKFLKKEIGETRINGTNGNTEYWSGDNYGWQSENGHNEALAKEKARADSAIDKPLWDAVDNGKQALGDFIAGVPGVKEAAGAVHFVTTKVQETAEYDRTNGSNGGDYSPANIAVGFAGAWQQGVDQFANGARSNYRAVESLIENGTGVELDDRGRDAYAGVLTSVAEGVAEGGAGGLLKAAKNIPLDPPKQLALAPVAGRVQLGNAAQAAQDNTFRLTLKDPANIPSGVKQGSAWSDEWAGQSREYFARRAAAKEKLQSLIDARKKKSRIRDAQADLYNDASTGWTRDPEGNPIAFGKSKFKEQSEVTPLTKSGNPQMKEQHHLFTKQESYQFIDRMSEIGDDDDLLAMFLMAEDMDAAIGGRFSNMLNVEKKSHQIGHSSRIYDGRQIKADEMANLVSSAKSTDELMSMFRKYIIENVRPSADEARALEIIGSRLHKMDKYKYLDELYDKMYRSPVVASR